MVTASKTRALFVQEEESQQADQYVNGFDGVDLNPITDDELKSTCTRDSELMHSQLGSNRAIPFCALNAFSDIYLPKKDDGSQNHSVHRFKQSQNQVYFYQKQRYKADNPNDDRGFYGLVAHSNRQDHNDKHAMCNDKEGRLYFMLFNLLMNMPQLLREEMIHYNKEFMDAFDINRHDVNLQVRIPINVNGMKALITDGKNSILKNFPGQ